MAESLANSETRVGFIGAGRMAQSLSKGFVASGLIKPEHITASASSSCSVNLKDITKIGVAEAVTNTEVVKKSDVIILAVKPYLIRRVLIEISPVVTKDKMVISIATGVTLATMEEILPEGSRVIRVTPNTPSLVRTAASVIAIGKCASEADGKLVAELMSAVGISEIGPEKYQDLATGVSGSGPAYAFVAIEALSDGGVKMGLPRDLATKLAAQTLLGAAKMVLETGKHPGQLKDEVCSPGGTTIAALHALEKAGFRAALMDAVETSATRAKEMG